MEQWDIARLIAPTPVETFYAEHWEKKALVMTHLPRFLSLLEEELYAER